MPIVIRAINKKKGRNAGRKKKGMGETKVPAKKNMGLDSMQPMKKNKKAKKRK